VTVARRRAPAAATVAQDTMVQVCLRLPSAVVQKASEQARRFRRTRSDVLRLAIDEGLGKFESEEKI
jgi:hypothetical protein